MPAQRDDDHFDYLLVGGGLQNGLLALALRPRSRPRASLVERGAALGGNHTWSFHDDDLPPDARAWVAPLVAHRWSAHEVAFPAHRRVRRPATPRSPRSGFTRP